MRCPKCGGKTLVHDTRHPDREHVQRWRKCKRCGYDFKTVEFKLDDIEKGK